MRLEKLFNNNFSTVENPFIVKENYNYFVSKIFQKNKIEINEDGTIIKSVVVVVDEVYPESFEEFDEEVLLKIELNQPFIYIIKDKNKLPIYIGYINETTFD